MLINFNIKLWKRSLKLTTLLFGNSKTFSILIYIGKKIAYYLFKEFDSVLWQQQWITLWVFFIQSYICLFNNQWIFMKNLNESRIKALMRIENGELSSRSSQSLVPGGWRVTIQIIENKVHHMLEGGGEGGDGSGCECVCAHALWRGLCIFTDFLVWVSLNKWEKCSLQISRETIIHVKGWASAKTLDIETHICKKKMIKGVLLCTRS